MKIEGGGVWGWVVPSPVGVWGLPQKKNQFCAKKYAILSKFWYLFLTLQQKVGGDYPESGGTYPPVPPTPTPMKSDTEACIVVNYRRRVFFPHSRN